MWKAGYISMVLILSLVNIFPLIEDRSRWWNAFVLGFGLGAALVMALC